MAEHYLALYRKYRPQTFEDVCGRDAIVRTLKNQIISGRIGHSYLFCGTRGTGKTTIAKIFAKAVNCEHPREGSPCGECASCRAIDDEANLNVVEMDAASNNGVDSIRSIIEQVDYSPSSGKYRVFIIDEVHMLSTAAFNALLKTLEEPPSYALFILATTDPGRLPLTILSRCQRYDFGRLPVQVIEERLKEICSREGMDCEDKALRYIASAADGSLRDGLSILDQCSAFNYGQDRLTYEKTLEILGAADISVFSGLFRALHRSDTAAALKMLDELLLQGREIMQLIGDFIGYLRNVLLLKASEDIAGQLDVSADNLALMLEDARLSELEEDLRCIQVLSALTDSIRYSANRRILTEAALIRLCNPAMDLMEGAQQSMIPLLERIRVLEDKVAEDERKLSEGAVFPGALQMAPAGREKTDAGSSTADGAVAPAQKPGGISAPKLPAALPDDIRNIARNWNALIGAIPVDHHFAKIHLSSAMPSVTEDNQLLVVFDNFVNADFFTGKNGEENRRYFEHYLSEKTGRDIPVGYKLLDKHQKFSDNYIDIRNAVQMNIEEEP